MTTVATDHAWPGPLNFCPPHPGRLCLGLRHTEDQVHFDLDTETHAIVLGPDTRALADVVRGLCLAASAAGVETTVADPTANRLAAGWVGVPDLAVATTGADVADQLADAASTLSLRLRAVEGGACAKRDLPPSLMILHHWSTLVRLEELGRRTRRRTRPGPGVVDSLTPLVTLGHLVNLHVVVSDVGYPSSLAHLAADFARGFRALLYRVRVDDAARLFPDLVGVSSKLPEVAAGEGLVSSPDGARAAAMYRPPPAPAYWPPDTDRPHT